MGRRVVWRAVSPRLGRRRAREHFPEIRPIPYRQAVADAVRNVEEGEVATRWSGALDRLVGGPGLRRGRRHPTELLMGEAVDFWRVDRIEPDRLLRLRAEMRLPGASWLQWEIEPDGRRSRLVQTALFAPTGLVGLAYWYGLYPLHSVIFSAMARAIAREAEHG